MKLTYVLLTWNRYKFLEKCLEALTTSTEGPISSEIIVMDNGSTDRTPEVLNRYRDNPRVRVIRRDKNYGLNAYKTLLGEGTGEYIVIVDDDVLEFPSNLNELFVSYMEAFPDYGFLALNVVQNEFTDGAKPSMDHYIEETRAGRTIERGPAGGWCACIRRVQYRKIRFRIRLFNLTMRKSEDGMISNQLWRKLGLKYGIMKDHSCFHATGPHYAREYGHLDREIEKYSSVGLTSYVETYSKFADTKDQQEQ
ncbi:glycosyltransferase family 2 protein [Silvibacterium sp.]|uniref:glycosyltransferase family 2 protein n=1 Tax=Silvibacterium sp. TaxID=1964179 RepID=UPI0039E5E3A3